MEEERYTVARMFRSYLKTAETLGLREPLSLASPALKKLFDKPPIDTARIPGSTCDELYQGVFAARGRDAIRSLGYEAMRGEGHALIGSLVENTFRLFGQTPEAVFSNLSMIVMPVVGNVDISWTQTEPRKGVVGLRPQGKPTVFAYAVWEGYLQYFFEACGTPGTVENAALAADQRSATIAVHW